MFKAYLIVKNALENREEGQGMVEYGLILFLVSVAAVLALTGIGGALTPVFENISGNLT